MSISEADLEKYLKERKMLKKVVFNLMMCSCLAGIVSFMWLNYQTIDYVMERKITDYINRNVCVCAAEEWTSKDNEKVLVKHCNDQTIGQLMREFLTYAPSAIDICVEREYVKLRSEGFFYTFKAVSF